MANSAIEVAVTYTDVEITLLVKESKPLPADWRTLTRLHSKRGHKENSLDLSGVDGNQFRLILRQNNANPLDFSIILAVRVPQSNRLFRLRRHNGRSHEHTNSIEGGTFYDFHIHSATERYQELGSREDAYAEATDRYSDFAGAVDCMLADAGFDTPLGDQLSFF